MNTKVERMQKYQQQENNALRQRERKKYLKQP